MKLAVISDIHGNYVALEAFMKYIETNRPDAIVCLGDYLTDGPYPQKTLSLFNKLLESYPCFVVKGNREEYLIQNFHEPKGWRICSASGALLYTSQNVTEEDIRFFEKLKEVDVLCLEDFPTITICHGSPTQLRGNFDVDRKLLVSTLKELETPYLLGGHSHKQELVEMFGRTYVNPGSLGLAIDGKGGNIEFAMLHGSKADWKVELISKPYDVERFLQDFTASGLDEYGMVLNRAVKKTLVTGNNYFYHAVKEACEIAQMPLDKIETEEVWQEVSKRLELGDD